MPRFRILIRDAKFDGPPDIEQALAGEDAEVDLHRLGDPDVTPERYALADALIPQHQAIVPAEIIAMMPRLTVIVRGGVGFERIDLAAAAVRGVPVCNVPDYGTEEVADHAIALLLALVRGVVLQADRTRSDLMDWGPAQPVPARRLSTLTLGVVGLGRIGGMVSRRVAGLGMRTGYVDPAVGAPAGLTRYGTLHDLLAASDVVTLHTPLNEGTRGMMDAAAFAAMRPGAILVNTSRGGVVDLDALHDALRSGHLAGAALDVLPSEPPDPTHPLMRAWTRDEDWLRGRFVLTPHMAYYSPHSLRDTRRLGMETALMFLRQGQLRNCVNADLLPR
ncbi:C-terminal binding protein [Roseomonas sp. CCTCC AB2023176]|uniref:C-terminal binding protein n=1 Tax=Roseomonas sp. CCTCC AB2023176 TaxID=3342640 RepID=UPI0035DFA346